MLIDGERNINNDRIRVNSMGEQTGCLKHQVGVTLVELIVFIVIISVAMGALITVFNQGVVQSVDPLIRVKALEKAQGLMDQVKSRKFDENTPTGGIPACDSTDGVACAGISADADYDDVGDFHNFVDNSDPTYVATIAVVEAGTELGLPLARARRITVIVTMPDGNSVTLTAYKVNY